MNHPSAETVSCTDAFDTWQEAEEHRQKLKNKDQHGLLCLWQSKDRQLTLAIILFLLATAVLLLVTIPFAMMLAEIEDLWPNIKFWSVVALAWAVVWFAVSYGQ